MFFTLGHPKQQYFMTAACFPLIIYLYKSSIFATVHFDHGYYTQNICALTNSRKGNYVIYAQDKYNACYPRDKVFLTESLQKQ